MVNLLNFLSGRVAKLEEKLDSLVMLLNNPSGRTPVAEPVEQLSVLPTSQSSISSPPITNAVPTLTLEPSRALDDLEPVNTRGESPVQLAEQGSDSIPPYARTFFQAINEQKLERANILLDRFRVMMAYFPFVVLPPTIDARTLSRERPFLYRAIMAAAEQDPIHQRDQAKDVVQYLALHMLQLGEKNLDMLLGVLVHLAWFGDFPLD